MELDDVSYMINGYPLVEAYVDIDDISQEDTVALSDDKRVCRLADDMHICMKSGWGELAFCTVAEEEPPVLVERDDGTYFPVTSPDIIEAMRQVGMKRIKAYVSIPKVSTKGMLEDLVRHPEPWKVPVRNEVITERRDLEGIGSADIQITKNWKGKVIGISVNACIEDRKYLVSYTNRGMLIVTNYQAKTVKQSIRETDETIISDILEDAGIAKYIDESEYILRR